MTHLRWNIFVTSMYLELNKSFLMQDSHPFREKKKATKIKGCSSLALFEFLPKPGSLLQVMAKYFNRAKRFF